MCIHIYIYIYIHTYIHVHISICYGGWRAGRPVRPERAGAESMPISSYKTRKTQEHSKNSLNGKAQQTNHNREMPSSSYGV